MTCFTPWARSATAVITAFSLLVATTPTYAASPAPAKAKPAADDDPPEAKAVDGGWPRAYDAADGGGIVIYQPQVASWEGQKSMVAYAAVAYTPKGAAKPEMGTARIEAKTKVAVEDRLVRFDDFRIAEANFPSLDKDATRKVVDAVQQAIPDDERVMALDRVLAAVDKSQIRPKNVEGVKADPPKIFYSTGRAILVSLDGKAIWSPIKDNDLKFAVNTNWDLFLHEPTKTHYLRDEGSWLMAKELAGPWTPAGQLPGSFAKLPADDNWKEVKAALPGKPLDPKAMPTIHLSEEPAEIILVQGQPVYKPVEGASPLVWLSNTESDVFRMGPTGAIYYLVSGRWFTAADFKGPWTFATPSLPAPFQAIPLEHPRSRVLAAVPGTDQAAEAVMLAQVPQTARVNKKELKAPEVAYSGEPKFEAIEQTKVERAVNTDKAILKVGDMYYMCFDGVWFMGPSPQGPWQACTKVPNEIYEIPASSPVHNVTYVTVEDDDDDWVTYAAVAGYTGMMVAWGCAVWGSGWYYPPYVGWGGYYPHYYPHYRSYGYGAYYNPWNGAYGAGGRVYGPYGGAGWGARYNPSTGTYARGAAAYGPYGSRYAGGAYNPRTGTAAATRGGSSVYGSWNQTAVQRGDNWAKSTRHTSNVTGNTTRVTQGSGGGTSVRHTGQGGSTTVGRTGSGNVYAGHDGNVYRKSDDGWQQYGGGGSWNNLDQPNQAQRDAARSQAQSRAGQADGWKSAAGGAQARTSQVNPGTYDQLSRDSRARSEGSQRTRDYSNYRSSSSSSSRSSAGSYRSSGGSRSGGFSRGGGGGRRR